MKRVRFIEPMSQPGSVFNRHIRHMPLIGPVLLGTVLAQRGHDVAVYNENLTGSVLDDPDAFADLADADFVGISILTPSANRGYRIADELRRNGRPRVAIGGVHASFRPDEALQHADFVVIGEGENVVSDIAEGRARPGVIRGTPVENMDALPLPDYSLVRGFESVWSSAESKCMYSFPVLTSRACPFNCSYCSVASLFGRKYRSRSAERVIEDIQTLRARGYRRFFFYDDNFVANRHRAMEILSGLKDLDLAWTAQVRLDFPWLDPAERRKTDRALLKVMRESGGDMLLVGYETIKDETAQKWHKGYRGAGPLEQRSAEDTRLLHETGMWIHGMFVIGPEDDEATVDGVVAFAKRNHIDSLQISALTPFPGTSLFEDLKQKLIFTSFPKDWDLYDGTRALFSHTRMGIQRFQEKLIEAYEEFYRHAAWSPRRWRKWLRGPGSLSQKLRYLWDSVMATKRQIADWENEMRAYLRRVAAMRIQNEAPAGDGAEPAASMAKECCGEATRRFEGDSNQ